MCLHRRSHPRHQGCDNYESAGFSRSAASQTLRKLSRRIPYNAYLSLQRDELKKASEFLWGSLTQAIKAVAALKELRLRSHREIWNYLVELSREWA